ncbi:MAG: YCF48-related protein [Bacteroidota bacterium]
MRSFLFVFLTTCLICFTSAQTEVIQAPFDFTAQFQSVEVASNGVGWAAGTCGSLIKTTDDGESWSRQPAPLDVDFGPIACAPGSNCQGLLLAADDYIFRSTNGGQSWTTIEIESRDPDLFYFFSDGVVLLMTDEHVFWRSDDSGASWSPIDLPNFPQAAWERQGDFIYTTFRVDTDTTAAYALVRSSDRGTSWDTLYTHPSYIGNIAMQDDQNGVFYSTDRMTYFTSDGGSNWTLGNDNISLNQLRLVSLGNDIYHAYYLPNRLSISTDGGINWEAQGQFNDFGRVNGVFYRNPDVFLASNQTAILKSEDLAMTFEVKMPADRDRLSSIAFFNDDVGYALGEGMVMRTQNGGDNWTAVQPAPLSGSVIRGEQVGVLADGSVIASWGLMNATISSDQGESWSDLLSPAEEDMLTNNLSHFAILGNGRILFPTNEQIVYSDDNGQSWNFVPADIPDRINEVSFLDNEIGYICTNNDQLYKSTDGGLNWVALTSPFGGTSALEGIAVLSEDRLIASRVTTAALSTDGGLSWTSQSSYPAGYDYDIDANGRIWTAEFAALNNGAAFTSSDNGESWSEIGYVCHSARGSTLTPSGNYFFVVGDGGLIVRYDVNAILSSTREQTITKESVVASPNPTYSFTTIDLSNQGSNMPLEMQVFDLSGQLLMQEYAQNKSQITLDLSAFAAGIYLVRVQGKDWIQSVRIIKQ